MLHLVGGGATLVFAARGGQGWTTGGRHVAAMEARRCRAIATRRDLDTARAPKAPPENLLAVVRAAGKIRIGAKKTYAHLPRAREFFDDIRMFCRQVIALNTIGVDVIKLPSIQIL